MSENEDSRSVKFLSSGQTNEQNEETTYRLHHSVYYIQLQVSEQTCISTFFRGNSSNIWCCIINIYFMSSGY